MKELCLFGDKSYKLSKREAAKLKAKVARGEMIAHKHFVTIEELDAEKERIRCNREKCTPTCQTKEELWKKIEKCKARLLGK